VSKLDKLIGARIKKAREEIGMSQAKIAEKLGLKSAQIVSNIENGERSLKASELNKWAKVLCVDTLYFLTPQEPTPKPKILCRGAEFLTVAEMGEIGAKFIKKCEQYHHLEIITGYEAEREFKQEGVSFNNNRDDFAWAEKLGTLLRNEMALGPRPALSLSSILEQKYGFKIWYMKNTGRPSGCATKGEFGFAVLIEANDAPWRRNYDLAHELFHVITWDAVMAEELGLLKGPDSKRRLEQLANVFASALLLPAEEVLPEVKARERKGFVAYEDLVNVARDFGVSTEALLWRLRGLNIVDEETINKFLDDEKLRYVDRVARIGDWSKPPLLPERFVRLGVFAYKTGQLSKGQLARYLDSRLWEVETKVADYGLNLEVLDEANDKVACRC